VYTELFRAVSLQLRDLLEVLAFDPSSALTLTPAPPQQQQQQGLSWGGISSSLAASITADRQQLIARLGKLHKAVQQLRLVYWWGGGGGLQALQGGGALQAAALP
jgi:hypothetical protein